LTDTLAIPNSGNNTLTFVGQSTVSLLEQNFSEVAIYPNPSANLLFVSSSEKKIARIELINEGGLVAAIYPVDNALDVSIDIKDVEKGTYFVRLYDKKQILIGIERFMKVN
jgi:hypothetical protein